MGCLLSRCGISLVPFYLTQQNPSGSTKFKETPFLINLKVHDWLSMWSNQDLDIIVTASLHEKIGLENGTAFDVKMLVTFTLFCYQVNDKRWNNLQVLCRLLKWEKFHFQRKSIDLFNTYFYHFLWVFAHHRLCCKV